MQKLNMEDNENMLQAYQDACDLLNKLRQLAEVKNPRFVKRIAEVLKEVREMEEQLYKLEMAFCD